MWTVVVSLPFSIGVLASIVVAFVRSQEILDCADCCSVSTTDPVQGQSMSDQGFVFAASVRNSYFVAMAFNAVFIICSIVLVIVAVDFDRMCGNMCKFSKKKSAKAHQYLEKDGK